MSETLKSNLNVPAAGQASFPRNFIKTAVCEVRFPTLLEIEERVPPAFQKAIRKAYPRYEHGTNVSVTALGVQKNTVHKFGAKDQRQVVSLKQAALALEYQVYDGFDAFLSAFERVLAAAQPVLDTDFYTRIGLRYINVLEFPTLGIDVRHLGDWINPELCSALSGGHLGDASHFWQEIRGTTDGGGFQLSHGLAKQGVRGYVIDIDFFSEDVEVQNAIASLKRLHGREFDLFHWCLGAKAKLWLENSR